MTGLLTFWLRWINKKYVLKETIGNYNGMEGEGGYRGFLGYMSMNMNEMKSNTESKR